jgi:hypothetical protein
LAALQDSVVLLDGVGLSKIGSLLAGGDLMNFDSFNDLCVLFGGLFSLYSLKRL